MIISTSSNSVEIRWDEDDTDETKEMVHHLVSLIRFLAMLWQRPIQEGE